MPKTSQTEIAVAVGKRIRDEAEDYLADYFGENIRNAMADAGLDPEDDELANAISESVYVTFDKAKLRRLLVD